ncbi:MAG TPA: hypothetical protein VHB68_17175 [Steroidobacteraceae bacterium]|nr:hypothetical protein [Steroidobacteraceae bacterium]
MKRESLKGELQRLLLSGRRPTHEAAEWVAVMVRGLDALEFLERSRDVAAETVRPSPPPAPVR